ncbi:hypothetical protein KL930_003821 [Ogataea haglerorum]|uniref:Arginine biosynthesis bifunctional protein ArgJ, mitochondrial n=1 Tax=Ogataea haglerorum TaxID=1937702 RepID=A0AAN6D4S9_9ASCO|nr:uncharacterized protein KL911_003960 [Ogataea haglerorum]KAG7694502.1 hypothetical protein KL915_003469 [Ogataea haglerorum]KAG7705162.1 hypothetical protein KL914_003848 [Ogataea haglerorum]KAG7705419.1 hypothetical protein KL950_003855 [Ogataea haglerorum]KAG7716712.1 hypothetical protein KL913_003228 [Ogataea haglerorum]KAG7717535.1 hypothetical protein KL949_003369 [Ogataea haglerorum]
MRKFSSASKILDKSRFVPSTGSYPQGYNVGALATGVKKNHALDLSILASSVPASAAAVFTTNKFQAAPVLASKDILSTTGGQNISAIVVNSGCANAVTGEGGLRDAYTMVETVGRELGVGSRSALVMSTGVIGQRLQIDKITRGITELVGPQLGSSHEHWLSCARGIMTTDTFPKLVSKSFELDGVRYSLAGLAKGAGMICPNMATLLGFFVTDAPIAAAALQKMLRHAADRSFNCISVDTDMSTNDTIAALANGVAGGETITEGHRNYDAVQAEITAFAKQLAQLVVRDGEGATKFITLKIQDALSYEDAKTVAHSIANSSLFKTAMYGKDANWGRILCATGYAGVEVNPSKTSVSFVPASGPALQLLVNGEPETVDEARASEILEQEDIEVHVRLGTGGGYECEFWTCDMSHEYVTINGDYRT